MAEDVDAGVNAPAALPVTYGGQPLVMALPQRDDRWLLLYGRERGEARYVVLVDTRASSPGVVVTSFDFARFFEAPDTTSSRAVSEAVVWAELDGDRLYVANAHSNNLDASHGRNAYITSIDTTTHAIVWRSDAQVANGGSFVVTDEHLLCAYDDYGFMRLFALDRLTGATVAAVPLPVPAQALWVSAGTLRARALDDELTFGGIPGLRGDLTRAAVALPRPVQPLRLPAFALDPKAMKERWAAIVDLEAQRPFDAAKKLRALVEAEGGAGNLASEALLGLAERTLDATRAGAEGRVLALATTAVTRASANRPAPIVQGPAPLLTKTSEAKELPLRGASVFDERHVPAAEIDKPYPGHAGDLPEYVPARLGPKLLFSARSTDSARTLIAVYGGRTVLFDTATRAAERSFDFTTLGASAEFPQVTRIEATGSVVIAAGGTTAPWLTAFDRASGAAYWTAAVAISDMLLVDGWIVGASTSRAHPRADFTTDISIIDAATGAVRSRVTTVRADRIARQGDELIGGGPTSRVVFAITRE